MIFDKFYKIKIKRARSPITNLPYFSTDQVESLKYKACVNNLDQFMRLDIQTSTGEDYLELLDDLGADLLEVFKDLQKYIYDEMSEKDKRAYLCLKEKPMYIGKYKIPEKEVLTDEEFNPRLYKFLNQEKKKENSDSLKHEMTAKLDDKVISKSELVDLDSTSNASTYDFDDSISRPGKGSGRKWKTSRKRLSLAEKSELESSTDKTAEVFLKPPLPRHFNRDFNRKRTKIDRSEHHLQNSSTTSHQTTKTSQLLNVQPEIVESFQENYSDNSFIGNGPKKFNGLEQAIKTIFGS